MKYTEQRFTVPVASHSPTPCTIHHPDAKGRCLRCDANLKDGQWHSQASDDGVTYKAKWTRKVG